MISSKIINIILYNILLPFLLIFSSCARINLRGLIYLIFLLLQPQATASIYDEFRFYKGDYYPKVYVLFMWFVSCIVIIGQLTFNILHLSNLSIFERLPKKKCDFWNYILRQIGLEQWFNWNIENMLYIILPDLIIFTYTSILLIIMWYFPRWDRKKRKIINQKTNEVTSINKKIDNIYILIDSKEIDTIDISSSALRSIFMYNMIDKLFPKKKNDLKFLRKEKIKSMLNNFIFIIILIIQGCFHPTLISFPYLILSSIYIISWISNKYLNSWHWALGKRIYLLYTCLYVLINYCYQFESINRKITQDLIISRLFGLVIYQSPQPCTNIIKTKQIFSYFWPEYISPLLGFFFYIIVSFQYISMPHYEVVDMQIQNKKNQILSFETNNDSKEDSQYEVNNNLNIKLKNTNNNLDVKKNTTSKKKLVNSKVIKKKELKHENDKKILQNIDNIFYSSNLYNLITSHSYLITLFTMIGWSMLYRSWSTFILLAIACIIWITPNSKKTCLKISFFVGIYSIILVLISFIYSLQLTEDELPDQYPTFLRQIGLEKPRDFSPCFHLYIKITFSFLILLSYREKIIEFTINKCDSIKEKFEFRKLSFNEKNNDKYKIHEKNLLKPKKKLSHISALIHDLPFKKDGIYEKIKKFFFQNVLIWIMILLLNASINNKVVIYRIIYMVFFLIFINMFFISFTNWRRFIYAYLMCLIIFSAIILILMYTYQFHGLPNFYKEYLGFSDDFIKSIGLEHYSPGQLIISILTPLSFLILALIQLNFFHLLFMKRTGHWNKILKLMRNPIVMPLKRLAKSLTLHYDNRLIHLQNQPIQSNDLEDQQSTEESSYNEQEYHSNEKISNKTSQKYSKVKQMMTKMEKNIKTIYAHKTKFVDVIWRFAEIHFDKVVAIFLAYTIFNEMSFINLPFIIILVVFPPGHVYFDEVIKLSGIWSSIIILMKLIYQLPIIDVKSFEIDCSMYIDIPTTENIKNDDGNLLEILGVKKNNTTMIEKNFFINPINWIGLQKVDNLYESLKNYIIFLFLLGLRFVVILRQHLKRHHLKDNTPLPSSLLFPGVNRKHADKNVKECLKFLSNFFFYKFGYEITLIGTAAVVAYRNDFAAFFHALWLFPPIFIPRTKYQNISKYHTLFVGIFLIYQYVICIGLPEIKCDIYPWEDLTSDTRSRLRDWLNLPSIKFKSNPKKIFSDFILYILLCCLDKVFEEEIKLKENHPGGSNIPTIEVRGLKTIFNTFKHLKDNLININKEDFILEISSKNKNINQFTVPIAIPVPDFISEKGTLLDYLKELIFIHFYWVTLAVLFLTGTSRVTLFALIYVLASFLFYWAGHSLFYLPIEYALKLFDILIFYSNSVMFMRVNLQVIGLLLIKYTNYDLCWFFQLNGIKYYNRNEEYISEDMKSQYNDIPYNDICDQVDSETGLFYDWLCFLFLVIQRRIFSTEYFKHVIVEFKIQKVFASKGANLIDEIRKNELNQSKEFENEILNKIKFKMEKIKSRNIKENIVDNENNNNNIEDDKLNINNPTYKKISTTLVQMIKKDYDFSNTNLLHQNRYKSLSSIANRRTSNPSTLNKILEFGERVTGRSSYSLSNPSEIQRIKEHFNSSKKKSIKSDTSSIGSSLSPKKDSSSNNDEKSENKNEDNKEFSSREKRKKTMKRTFSINLDGPIMSFDQADYKNIDEEECGVRGLGPLQLLNFAFKKGAIKDAVKESNEIQATHDRLTKEMEDNYGISNYNLIRKAILKQKANKVKPDFDEYNFNEDNDYTFLGNRISTSESIDDKNLSTLSSECGNKNKNDRKISSETKEWEYIKKKTLEHYQKSSVELSEKDKIDDKSTTSTSENSVCEEDINDSKNFQYPENDSEIIQESDGDTSERTVSKRKITRIKKFKINCQYFFDRCRETSKNLANFIYLLAVGTIESFIAYLMFLSRDYRYIYNHLEKEKRQYRDKLNENYLLKNKNITTDNINIPKIKILKAESFSKSFESSISRGSSFSEEFNYNILQKEKSHEDFHKSISYSWRNEYRLVRLVKAIYYLFLSRSEIICYLMIFINHMNSGSLISMPLPLMTLLWGTLTVPRPSKRFWITIITYTEFIVVFKYLFQFGFFPWNHNINISNPFWIPRIIGIEKKKDYATYDLFLLMTLFFHRSTLITIGLWKTNKTKKIIKIGKKKIEKKKKKQKDIDDDNISRRIKISKSDSYICRKNSNEIEENCNLTSSPIVSRNFPFRIGRNQSLKIRKNLGISKTIILGQHRRKTFNNKVKSKLSTIKIFFQKLLDSTNRCSCDVFVSMFICDVICFLIIIFGFSGFGTGTGHGSVAAYLEQNKIPGTLVSMLIIQFLLIIFDRAFFLRKFIFGKLIFQIFLVIFIHIWMFILLPAATERMFVNNLTCKLFYFTKVVYFLISAAQIRAGYPRRSLSNYNTYSYTALNLLLYKLFMLVPFLFELRSLMDWIWMDTSLGLGDWFSLHDIYSHIAMLKCERNIEEDYPSPKGVKKRPFHKYGLGGVYLVFMIFVIWFPLVLFSMANTVGVRSLPVECTLKLTISGYQPLFISTAQLSDVRETNEEEYQKLLFIYRTSKYARNYLADYGKEDVVKTNVNGNSSVIWQISPPSREQLINDLESDIPISLKFEWIFKRAYNDELQQYGEVSDFNEIILKPKDIIRQKLIDMISYKKTYIEKNNNSIIIEKEPILIEKAFPPMVVITGEGIAEPATALLVEQLPDPYSNIHDAFFDVLIDLEQTEDGIEWWRMRMIDKNWDPIKKTEQTIRPRTCIYAFVDKVFPKKFSFITGGGILGLYLSMVLFLGRFIRVQVTGAMQKIMFEELPNVDRLLQLCIDIFLVRDAGEFELEEDLYAKLVFLFRSPTTLIKWTKDNTL
ncbi:Piezo family-containing protein [Strongyloides ratti]|uniref:Piezo family-containing protein n=1 Tax=Strongyloides ratti TaxID=34506 RepID=A0A090KX87_STRRB|nr:Piezo family-containing protein [Strongyloides ratti]CEF59857.1 Piezo family-containing protein [Strongyloides ratti]